MIILHKVILYTPVFRKTARLVWVGIPYPKYNPLIAQGPAYYDFTTNYCNLRNLMTGSGLADLEGYR